MKSLKLIVPIVLCIVLSSVFLGCQGGGTTASNTAQLGAEATEKTVSIPDKPFYVLVVGNDSRTGTTEISLPQYADGSARSDTMILMRIDPKTYQITLVTIPRDTESTVNGNPGRKINDAYHEMGIDGAVNAVEELTGVTVTYYFDMGFVEFEKFIDALGGVTADVPIDMSLKDVVGGDMVTLDAGTQPINGPEALVLARVRKQYADDQDACRQIQDRQIVEVAISQIAKNSDLVSKGVNALLANADTNWKKDELTALVTDFATHANQVTFISGTGPYKGYIFEEYEAQWLVPRDEASWHEVMQVVDAGGDPSSVIALPEVKAAS